MKVAKTMLSLIIAVSALLLGGSFYAENPQKKNDQPSKPAIVFDLGGVVFDTSRRAFFTNQLGRNALPYILLHCSKTRIKDRWFETLNQIAQENNHSFSLTNLDDKSIVVRDESDNPLPAYMVEWLCANRPNQTIYREVRQGIKQHPEWFGPFEQTLMLNMARGIFKPEQFASSRKVLKPTVKLIKKLKKQGYPLYILSNWDAETFALMKEEYSELFALFDGYVVSGEVHTAKPSKDIYELFMSSYPHDCYCFIDDQQDNIDAAQKCGWHGIKTESRNPDIKMIKKEIAQMAVA